MNESTNNRTTFQMSTGVRPASFGIDKYNNEMYKPFRALMEHEVVNSSGVLCKTFECEGVPEGAKFAFASDNPNAKLYDQLGPFETFNSGLVSKYVYFWPKRDPYSNNYGYGWPEDKK